MTMLDDVLGAAVPGAKNRICTLWRRRKAKPGGDPSSTGMLYQIPLIRTRGPIGAVRWT